MAFLIPLARDLLCLVKKLTVIGIIGKTHGVNNAAKPEKNAIMKIDHKPFCSDLSTFTSSVMGLVLANVSFDVVDAAAKSSKFNTSFDETVAKSNTKYLV